MVLQLEFGILEFSEDVAVAYPVKYVLGISQLTVCILCDFYSACIYRCSHDQHP